MPTQKPSCLVAQMAEELGWTWEEACDIVVDLREKTQSSTRVVVREVLAWVRVYKAMESVASTD